MPHTFPANTRFAPAAVTTTGNDYVTVAELHVADYRTVNVILQAADNALHVRVTGSVDGGSTYPATVQSETSIAADGVLEVAPSKYYTNLKIEVKPAVADAHGTLTTEAAAIAA